MIFSFPFPLIDTIWSLTSLLLVIHLYFHDYGYMYPSHLLLLSSLPLSSPLSLSLSLLFDAHRNAVSDRFMAPVSVNAAIFASVCLASRLKNSLYVFVFISFAIVTFALFPNTRNRLRVCTYLLFTSPLTFFPPASCLPLLSNITNWLLLSLSVLLSLFQRFSVELHVGLTVLLFVLAACLILSVSYFIAIAYIVSIFSITFVGPYGLIFIQKYKKYAALLLSNS